MFPTYDESIEKVEEVRADDGIEIGAIQNNGVVCNGKGVIYEDIAENLDGDVGDGVKTDGADDRFGFIINTRNGDCSDLREER